MAEGTAVAGRVTGGGVHDDPDSPPPPSAEAPRGWTWNRKGSHWQPKIRGKILWEGVGSDTAAEPGTGPANEEPGGPPRRDPDPPWMSQDTAPAPAAKAEATQQVKDDIGGILGFAGAMLLPGLVRNDPHCGTALAENYERIVEKCIPLICRSQTVVKFLTSDTGGLMDWIGLAMALAPVGKAVLEHHVARTVVTVEDEDTGERAVVPADYSDYPAAA